MPLARLIEHFVQKTVKIAEGSPAVKVKGSDLQQQNLFITARLSYPILSLSLSLLLSSTVECGIAL